MLGVSILGSWAVVGCSTDEPVAPPTRIVPVLRLGALTQAPALVQQAMRGVRVRGEQDDMLRREAALAGFGGFYIDSLDHMVVYMKRGSAVADANVRQVLVKAYSGRAEPRIRSLMPSIANARIVPGDFTLSELIAIENRISQSTVRIPGFTGVGTSLVANRVVVGFLDAADVDAGLSAIQSMGIPANALVGEVWGAVRTSSSFDQQGPVRPTRGGLLIELHNGTTYPDAGGFAFVETCSLGFNVRWHPAGQSTYTDYMMTAAHCANEYRGMNGVTGDTVYQPRISSVPGDQTTNLVGFVAVNQPWEPNNPSCNTNPANGSRIDYCIDADVMLIRPAPGISMDRRLATSMYQGYNGSSGTMQINNWYPIQSVVPPEWLSTYQYGAVKSGATTGTTSGQAQLPVTQVYSRICWGRGNCPNATGTAGGKQVVYWNVVKVLHAGWGLGDSGGVVFQGYAGGGGPYVAVGIQVAGMGTIQRFTDERWYCVSGTACSFYFVPWSFVEQSVQTQLGSGTLSPVTNQ